jgi:cold shock protein
VTIGTVQFFNVVRGFGFIRPDSGDRDVFVHISAIEAGGLHPPQEGDRVEFDTQPGRGGKLQAINLKLAA